MVSQVVVTSVYGKDNNQFRILHIGYECVYTKCGFNYHSS